MSRAKIPAYYPCDPTFYVVSSTGRAQLDSAQSRWGYFVHSLGYTAQINDHFVFALCDWLDSAQSRWGYFVHSLGHSGRINDRCVFVLCDGLRLAMFQWIIVML